LAGVSKVVVCEGSKVFTVIVSQGIGRSKKAAIVGGCRLICMQQGDSSAKFTLAVMCLMDLVDLGLNFYKTAI
jgi:hypothetical protein